jgi:type I restriction enzyme S subunit
VEVKPGYKQTEAGVIPEDWGDPQLAEIAKDDSPICYGIVQVGPYTRNGIPVLAIKNLKSDYTINVHRASVDIERPYARSRIRPGDILISVKGTTGRVGIVPDGFHGNISRDLARLRLGECAVAMFCFQMLQSDLAQRRLAVAVVGTTRMELSIAILKQIRIPLPPTKAEQEAIAEALSDTDALIESLEQLIAKKRQIKQGAMRELLRPKDRWIERCIAEIADCLDHLRIPLNNIQRAKMKGDFPYCGANGILDYINDYCVDDSVILMAEDGGYFDEYMTRPIAYRLC